MHVEIFRDDVKLLLDARADLERSVRFRCILPLCSLCRLDYVLHAMVCCPFPLPIGRFSACAATVAGLFVLAVTISPFHLLTERVRASFRVQQIREHACGRDAGGAVRCRTAGQARPVAGHPAGQYRHLLRVVA